ncbi:prepilin-type N-terminal cleavage/methylation domain-containing protein [Candidatus Roizmanbacteria bacterium]|nr:prepilin-type N-terminal cleavage/methylation domain-containing protein [Candidatus Roizmanbacteria bacterium]
MKKMKSQKAFTLLEISIIVTIIAIVIGAAISLLDPFTQIKKSWDASRKKSLDVMRKILEDRYNDKGAYPTATDICYTSASAPRTDYTGNTACTCYICGKDSSSPSFSPYLNELACDPQYPSKHFLYDYDCSTSKPAWYRIYTKLSITGDPIIKEVGCSQGCGPSTEATSYNYYVGTLAPEQNACNKYDRLYQLDQNQICNICKSPSTQDVCNLQKETYIDAACSTPCAN